MWEMCFHSDGCYTAVKQFKLVVSVVGITFHFSARLTTSWGVGQERVRGALLKLICTLGLRGSRLIETVGRTWSRIERMGGFCLPYCISHLSDVVCLGSKWNVRTFSFYEILKKADFNIVVQLIYLMEDSFQSDLLCYISSVAPNL